MKKAMIAMSGGVDSSVAAWLMKRDGYDCMGVTMRLFAGEDSCERKGHTCCSLDDVEDARSVARQLGIPYFVFNFTEDFGTQIMDRFVCAYENGFTPNPCIDCNRYMKFEKLMKRAKELDYDYVVTGHYARIEEQDGKFLLKKAIDEKKDQSYVLYSLTQELTSLVACKNVVAKHQAGHGTKTLAMTGDESAVTCAWVDEKGEAKEQKCSLTEAFNTARSTKDTRKGVMSVRVDGDIYTYTGFYFRDVGAVELNLNGYAIKNDYQNYALYFVDDSRVTICDTPDRSGVNGVIESTTYSAVIMNGADVAVNFNGGIIRQTTGIAVNVMDGATVTLSGEGAIEGQIGLQAGTNVAVTIDGGSISATKMGIQATPEEDSTTAITVHSGEITSKGITIYAKKVTFDGVAGKTATLKGTLSLTEKATITEGTRVMANGAAVSEIKYFEGTVMVEKK